MTRSTETALIQHVHDTILEITAAREMLSFEEVIAELESMLPALAIVGKVNEGVRHD